ncbi:BQ5605_C013g07159 [Microbotryum silenes-dioicae]|uniref:BQ5605_C013g07159 protein n=1 Tax=Microbotryum silenes-dioicae TaxID=796604 RepID=A0A2X0LVQ0_9BASI|nr:BQ5605_C013g07159 [Microbotryum silenes-dioicae]
MAANAFLGRQTRQRCLTTSAVRGNTTSTALNHYFVYFIRNSIEIRRELFKAQGNF